MSFLFGVELYTKMTINFMQLK